MGRRSRRDAVRSVVILVDTSAWIEFLRDTGSRTCNAVGRLLDTELACCDMISMELLAGARDDAHLTALRGLVARTTVLPLGPTDYDDAASLYRTCRRNGGTVRNLTDCLIAAVAMREHVPLLHADRDFASIAQHAPLVLHRSSS